MQSIDIKIYDGYGCEWTVCVSEVDYTNHELIVKTLEGEQIAGFKLDFSEGILFRI